MAPYRIIKQGYMLKEPPYSKRGMRKVRRSVRLSAVSTAAVARRAENASSSTVERKVVVL